MELKIIVLAIVLLKGIYSVILNLFERKSAKNPIPENVSDVYDEETYLKWKNYQAEHAGLELISDVVSLIISLAMLATDVYSVFASLFPSGYFWQIASIVLLETAVDTVVGIFFSYRSTMVIEQKYGFNKSTVKTFVIDKIRGFIVSLLLGLFLAFLIFGLHQSFGDAVIIFFAVAMFLFSLLLSFLYPILSRIGNKFTPLPEGELRTKLMELLTSHGYKVKEIQVMDASRRTTKLNAYFSGLGSTKTIVLYDNLVNAMDTDEICAVFAHELGHGIHKDVPKLQALNIVNMLLMAVAVWISVREGGLHTAFGFEGVNYGFAYILTGIFISLIQPLTSILVNAVSRRAEYRADEQAVTEGYGRPMITALKKLARENFAELAPTRMSVLLHYNHPPLSERIAAVEKKLEEKQ